MIHVAQLVTLNANWDFKLLSCTPLRSVHGHACICSAPLHRCKRAGVAPLHPLQSKLTTRQLVQPLELELLRHISFRASSSPPHCGNSYTCGTRLLVVYSSTLKICAISTKNLIFYPQNLLLCSRLQIVTLFTKSFKINDLARLRTQI